MAKILIIDDDEIIRLFLEEILTTAGHQVQTLEDGNRVCEAIKSDPPQLMICDLIMPGQEGIETIKKVKSSFPQLPIVAISGSGLYLNFADKLGADAVIEKPIERERVIATLDSLLPIPT